MLNSGIKRVLLNKNIARCLQNVPKECFGGGHHEIDHNRLILRDQKTGYYLDPNEVARRMMRIIALHDAVKDPEQMTLNSQWHELGINELDYVEIMIGVQEEFKLEFPDEAVEKFKDIHDCVQYVSRSFWAA